MHGIFSRLSNQSHVTEHCSSRYTPERCRSLPFHCAIPCQSGSQTHAQPLDVHRLEGLLPIHIHPNNGFIRPRSASWGGQIDGRPLTRCWAISGYASGLSPNIRSVRKDVRDRIPPVGASCILRGIVTHDRRLVVLDRHVLPRVHRQREPALSLSGMLSLHKLAAAVARRDDHRSGQAEIHVFVFSSVAPAVNFSTLP